VDRTDPEGAIAAAAERCSNWGLGHIFDHGLAWNGRRAGEVVTSDGDRVTGIETAAGLIAGRGVLLDAGRVLGEDGELPDGWGEHAGGPSPGLSFTTAGWLHRTEIAGIATDTWGFEVRPNEFDDAFQPLHQVAIPHIGLFLGEMWDFDALAADCAADGRWDFWLTAAPLPVTGAVGAPVNPIAVK
jgi:hypothetical protein